MSELQTPTGDRILPAEECSRSVHVRGVPEAVWRRARQNALLSGLPFKAYVIRVLAEGTALPTGDIADSVPAVPSACPQRFHRNRRTSPMLPTDPHNVPADLRPAASPGHTATGAGIPTITAASTTPETWAPPTPRNQEIATNETHDAAATSGLVRTNPEKVTAVVDPSFDLSYITHPRLNEDTPPVEVAAFYNEEFDLDDLALGELEATLRYTLWVFRCVKWTNPERPNPLDNPDSLAARLARAAGEFVYEIIDDCRPENTAPGPDDAKAAREILVEALARRRAEGKSDPN